MPVSITVAKDILNDLQNQKIDKSVWQNLNSCGQKNTTSTYNLSNYGYGLSTDSIDTTYEKSYGDPEPVEPVSCGGQSSLNLTHQQTKLLKTVVEYLNQASTALYFSNNRFLSSAAKDLANQVSDKFCIG